VKPTEIFMVGDLVLDLPHVDDLFEPSRPTLRSADILIGHVEVPHTTRGIQADVQVPAHGSDPGHLKALKRSGFHVATLAGNHIYDAGDIGVADTIAALKELEIAPVGAGMNIQEAAKPAYVTRNGLRVGVLAYNTIGPTASYAGPKKAGGNFVNIITHYELDYPGPGGPPGATYSFPEATSLRAMKDAVASLREQVDIVVVAFHKGIVHVPTTLAMYERPLAEAAIDVGADIVIGHHAHILKGVEVYRGKPIYHGLGNFVTVTQQLSTSANLNPSPERLAWAKRRKALFNFEPDPNYPTYPFHPEAKHTIIATCEIGVDKRITPGFIPCFVQPNGAPTVLSRTQGGEALAAYMAQITRDAGLTTRFSWAGDRVVFC
jgi:poly-gamma-glutamate capsule biosynthesis protein CapA/YwtB (metallophosphatase superfamily)